LALRRHDLPNRQGLHGEPLFSTETGATSGAIGETCKNPSSSAARHSNPVALQRPVIRRGSIARYIPRPLRARLRA
jgi:hypothetical protein